MKRCTDAQDGQGTQLMPPTTLDDGRAQLMPLTTLDVGRAHLMPLMTLDVGSQQRDMQGDGAFAYKNF